MFSLTEFLLLRDLASLADSSPEFAEAYHLRLQALRASIDAEIAVAYAKLPPPEPVPERAAQDYERGCGK